EPGQRTMAVLVLLARSAGAGLVTADLAFAPYECALRFIRWRRHRKYTAPRKSGRRFASSRSYGSGRSLRTVCAFDRQQGLGFRVLSLQRSHQPQTPLLFLAVHLVLSANLDLRQHGDRFKLHAVEHRGKQLEGFPLVLEPIVLLGVATQMNSLTQIVHST